MSNKKNEQAEGRVGEAGVGALRKVADVTGSIAKMRKSSGRGWYKEPTRHSLASKGVKTTYNSVSFEDEREKNGIHIGDENQYQHSRFRCPECYRGTGKYKGEHMCRIHGPVDALDTNKMEDLEEMIDAAEYSRDEDEEEHKKLGDKTLGESWYDYFTKKKEYIKKLKSEGKDIEDNIQTEQREFKENLSRLSSKERFRLSKLKDRIERTYSKEDAEIFDKVISREQDLLDQHPAFLEVLETELDMHGYHKLANNVGWILWKARQHKEVK